MPRPIHVAQGAPGISTYTLGVNDEWTLRAATFNLVALAGAGADNLAWFDMRDPAGGIIYLQPLSPGDGTNMWYSLSVDASEFQYPNVNFDFIPQDGEAYGNNYVSQRLSPHTLYSGCTVNAYKSLGTESPPTDPITNLSTFYTIPDLHLWVDDVQQGFDFGPVGNPILLGIGA